MTEWLGGTIIIRGAPLYTLTVGDDQADGTYSLAGGASRFNQTITVVNTFGTELGTLSVGIKTTINGIDYRLKLKDDVLSVAIGEDATEE